MSELKVIDFMGKRKFTATFSIVLIVVSIVALAANGLRFGLDFTGGTLVELHYSEAPVLEEVRDALAKEGYSNAVVVNFGSDTELMVRLQTDNSDLGEGEKNINIGEIITEILQQATEAKVELKRSEVIGAQIGEELANDGGLGLLMALAVVFIYVALRFQFKFSMGAVIALAHDVIIVLGVFALFQLDFDLTVLAAVLAVIGYSLNDTIVVADRIRENFRKLRSDSPIEIINESLTQTLGRTIMTSGTTLLVLLALFFVGGELIHNFSLALLVGIGVGTYSSIYVAATILLWAKISKEDLIPPEKEGEEFEELP